MSCDDTHLNMSKVMQQEIPNLSVRRLKEKLESLRSNTTLSLVAIRGLRIKNKVQPEILRHQSGLLQK